MSTDKRVRRDLRALHNPEERCLEPRCSSNKYFCNDHLVNNLCCCGTCAANKANDRVDNEEPMFAEDVSESSKDWSSDA
jgi:hypothetical protein